MSQYISELLYDIENCKSDSRKKKLKEECCKTILMLWDKRSKFPQGAKPLYNFENVLSVLNALAEPDPKALPWSRYYAHGEDTDWAKFLRNYKRVAEDVLDISLLSSFTKKEVLEEKEWLKFKKFLSHEEVKIIELLDFISERGDQHITVHFIDGNNKVVEMEEMKNMKTKLLEKIEERINKQLHYLNELKKSL